MLDIARCPWCSLTCRTVEYGPDQASGGEGGEERENALNERECGSLSTLVGVRPTRSPGELPEATGRSEDLSIPSRSPNVVPPPTPKPPWARGKPAA